MKKQKIIGKKVSIQDFLPRSHEFLFRRDCKSYICPRWTCEHSDISFFICIDLADFLDFFGIEINDAVKFAIIETDYVHMKFSEVDDVIRINLTFK